MIRPILLHGGLSECEFYRRPQLMIRPTHDEPADSVELNNAKPAVVPSSDYSIEVPTGGGDCDSLSERHQPSPIGAPDLIPVRMLNEFTYCPRLGYLEFVHGEWEDNFETTNGTFGHRRVDKPDRQNIAKAEDRKPKEDSEDSEATSGNSSNQREPIGGVIASDSSESPTPLPTEATAIHARSIMLSAPDERLIAKLDLLELDGLNATPVDYKRGKAPRGAERVYEPEQVQLCAQGLVLRENGFQCDEGVLYFIGSKKRVTIPFTDELIARTRQLRDEFLQVSAGTDVPPPLVDSPKCPRCSLVGICLPDEVVFLQGAGEQPNADFVDNEHMEINNPPHTADSVKIMDSPGDSDTNFLPHRSTPAPAGASRPPVRKLLPARDDSLPFYVQDFGAMLGKSGDRLQVKKKGEVIGERRMMDVSQVSLFGSVIVSAQALSELMARGIPICHFSHGGWFHGMTTGLVHKNVQLRIRQYATAADPVASVVIARQLISGKIRNCRTFLRRHLGSENKPLLDKLDRYRRKAEVVESCESLLGIEGIAAKEYFSGLFELLRGRHDFDVNDRNRRPPRDPVNAVLSFAYALLTKELTITLQAVGFDPMLGLLHQPRYGRPSLALDLAEEYRPLIADSVMLTAFNNGELPSHRFLERAGAVTLTPAGRAALIAAFERRMTTEITHPVFGYKISYRRLLEVQARLLARTLLGEIDQYPAFCTR
jgi:CRISP-associated protein Cas1